MPEAYDPEGVAAAMRLAPDPLKSRWAEVGGSPDDPDAAWHGADIRRQMLSIGLHHGALAVSYGGDGVSTVANKVDNSKLVLVAIQQFAQASGYSRTADIIRERFTSRVTEGQDVIRFVEDKPGFLAVHAPYNPAFNDAARNRRDVFVRFFKDGKLFFRVFQEKKLNDVVNILQGVFGDAMVLNPAGKLVLLPSMAIEETPVPSPPAPAPKEETGETAEKVPQMRGLRVGDVIKLPDGGSSTIQFVSWKSKRVAVGDDPKAQWIWFSFDAVETVNSTKIYDKKDAALRKEAAEEGAPPPEEPKAPARELPTTLMSHQVDGVRFIDERRRVLLADDMGLGKTITALIASDPPVVIVCPALVKVNWVRECTRWRPDLVPTLISGSGPPSPLQMKANVFVINYDILHHHVEWLSRLGAETLIADEAHYLKNMDIRWDKEARRHMATGRSPRRAQAFYALHEIPKLMLLTGTPIMNRTSELFPLLHMLDKNTWNSGYQFAVRYCAGHVEFVGSRKIFDATGRSNTDELHRRINNKVMLRRTKDVLDLPEKQRFSKLVSLSAQYAKEYKKASTQFIRYVEEHGGPEKVEATLRAKVLTQMGALRELSALGKVEAALEWISEHLEGTGRPLVVMGWHVDVFAALASGIDKLNSEYEEAKRKGVSPEMSKPIRYGLVVGGMGKDSRQKVIDDFQAGQLDVCLYSIAIATGTTLTRSSDMLFMERAWRPGDNVQAEDRIYRIGQRNKVTITYLDADGTIDAVIATLLMDKVATAAGVIDGINYSEDDAVAAVFGAMFFGESLRKNPDDGYQEVWWDPIEP